MEKKDGVPISGATSSQLNVQNDNDHKYTVTVSNAFGSTSESTRLRIALGGTDVFSSSLFLTSLTKTGLFGEWDIMKTVDSGKCPTDCVFEKQFFVHLNYCRRLPLFIKSNGSPGAWEEMW